MKELALAAALVTTILTGCNNGNDKNPTADRKATSTKSDGVKTADAAKADTVEAMDAAKQTAPEYHEVKNPKHPSRIYVVGSKSNAEKIAKGGEPQLSLTRIGAGPAGETVVFEADKDGKMESALQAEFTKRHPNK